VSCCETLLKFLYLMNKLSSGDNVGDDCPVFDGLFDYCSISAGGSMGTTHLLSPFKDVLYDVFFVL
jgi:hypothetical protein